MSQLIPITQLRHDPGNPVERLDDVEALARSLTAAGQLQSLLVEPDGAGGYVVLAGNRRLAAAQLAGLAELRCEVRDPAEPVEKAKIRLIENGHRRNHAPMDQARAFAYLRDVEGLNMLQIAQQTGFSHPHVSNRLALLRLDKSTQDRIERGVLSAAQAMKALRGAAPSSGQAGIAKPQVAGQPTLSDHFGPLHPLLPQAAELCRARHRAKTGRACPPCWEQAIRVDAAGDDAAGVGDSDVFDPVKVTRAADPYRPLPPGLTRAERNAAIRLALFNGVLLKAAAERFRLSEESCRQIRDAAPRQDSRPSRKTA